MSPDFERALIDLLFRGGEGPANDFEIYAPPEPAGPKPVLNAVSIEQDMERVLGPGGLERLAARRRAERWPWSEAPATRAEWPAFKLSLDVAMPAPFHARIIMPVLP